jgi:hypothetical protein
MRLGRWGEPVGPHGIEFPAPGSYGHWHPDVRGATAGDPYPKPGLFSGDPLTFLMEARSAYKKSEGDMGPYSAAVPLYARMVLNVLEDHARWGIALDAMTLNEQAWVFYSANVLARDPGFAENYGETLEEWNLVLLGLGAEPAAKPYTPPGVITQPPIVPPTPPVAPPAGTLRLLDRFDVAVKFWIDHPPGLNAGSARMTDTTGYWWFFSPNNVEVLVKILDGKAVNGKYWVFIAGLTNVGVQVSVIDSTNGNTKTYTNELNTVFQSIQDTEAFS